MQYRPEAGDLGMRQAEGGVISRWRAERTNMATLGDDLCLGVKRPIEPVYSWFSRKTIEVSLVFVVGLKH